MIKITSEDEEKLKELITVYKKLPDTERNILIFSGNLLLTSKSAREKEQQENDNRELIEV